MAEMTRAEIRRALTASIKRKQANRKVRGLPETKSPPSKNMSKDEIRRALEDSIRRRAARRNR